MSISQFELFAKLEQELRDALNAPPPPPVNKTALKKLRKKELARGKFKPELPPRPPVAHVVVSCRKPWGGKLEVIDYTHTNCSMFEAEIVVDQMIRARKLIKHVVLNRELCEPTSNRINQ